MRRCRARTLLPLAGVLLFAGISGCSSASDGSAFVFPGSTGSAQPRLAQGPDGSAVLSWLERDGSEYALQYVTVAASGRISSPVEVARSDQMFVNWADFPSVTPIIDDVWFAHWLKRRPGSGAYDIATAISRDGGRTWSDAEQMNEDSAEAEHGFVSVFEWEGEIAAFWLDGREFANWSFDDPDALLGTSLRLATYDASGSAETRTVIDDMVCDCCQPDVALTALGPIVAYRDRTPEEIRDVVIRRFDGDGWSGPLSLGNEGWFIEGCPVNGPSVAANGNEVAVAWFTAHDGRGHVRLTRSTDAGVSFDPPVEVDGDGSYGQTGIALEDGGRAIVSWWRRSDQGGIDLVMRAYERDGTAGPATVAAHESVGQPVDVPQILPLGNQYLVAWTTFSDGGTVRLNRVEL
jgi:hypothetical protein